MALVTRSSGTQRKRFAAEGRSCSAGCALRRPPIAAPTDALR
eukprot:CAMPEP_0175608748 /NCGR_PEP_ID=MMETSP0096-20121207/61909_1 /TAXON_ID=311494 /ORGANISM="Alexandrium monilatum, Strain CCMP3105" /LENGTH=41 /DNA_ID= /DNA_START= /DNA_END= /DNA_ORIENTATION=